MKIKRILAVSMLAAVSLLGGCGDKEQTAVVEPEIEKITDQSVQDTDQEMEAGESDAGFRRGAGRKRIDRGGM